MLLKNTTSWDNVFLRRMLSWICRELELPVRFIRKANFGNRSNTGWSGHAYSERGVICVRIGPDRFFPVHAHTHGRKGDKFSIGIVKDRIEALVKVTAHEAAHCNNARLGNRTRGNGRSRSNGGSERMTDRQAKYVLDAFREKREELLAAWSKPTARSKQQPSENKPKVSPVAKRAARAAAMVARWERRQKHASAKLKAWQKKLAYYQRKYPDGVFPDPVDRKSVQRKPKTSLRSKLSKYLSLAVRYYGLRVASAEVWDFDGQLTRPHEDYEWDGSFTNLKDARNRMQLGDELEIQSVCRYGTHIEFTLTVPPDENKLDECLKSGELYQKPEVEHHLS